MCQIFCPCYTPGSDAAAGKSEEDNCENSHHTCSSPKRTTLAVGNAVRTVDERGTVVHSGDRVRNVKKQGIMGRLDDVT